MQSYRFIKKQGPEKDWQYVIQKHKNQNGTHFDLRLAKPGSSYAYSWASKKSPMKNLEPIMTRRTHDHIVQHMDFEGPLVTAKGKGTVKKLHRGIAKIHSIHPKKGIVFELDTGEKFILKNIRGKKYMISKK